MMCISETKTYFAQNRTSTSLWWVRQSR